MHILPTNSTVPSPPISIPSTFHNTIPRVSFFSDHETHVLQEASSILQCHVDQLVGLDRQLRSLPHIQNITSSPASDNAPRKRQRLDSESTMHWQRSDDPGSFGQEMSEDHRRGNNSSAGFSLTQYLPNFAVCSPCTTCDPPSECYSHVLISVVRVLSSGQGYTEVPAVSYSDHTAAGQLFGHGLSMSQALPGTAQQAVQSSVFDDSGWGVPTSIPGYPVLQASRPMMMQPTTRGEGMVYPVASPGHNYAAQLQQNVPINDHMISPQAYVPSPSDVHRASGASSFSGATYQGTFPSPTERPDTLGQGQGVDLFVASQQRPAQAKRGPFKTTKERQATAETRKIGSCIRCRMQRIRVSTSDSNLSGPSVSCQDTEGPSSV